MMTFKGTVFKSRFRTMRADISSCLINNRSIFSNENRVIKRYGFIFMNLLSVLTTIRTEDTTRDKLNKIKISDETLRKIAETCIP